MKEHAIDDDEDDDDDADVDDDDDDAFDDNCQTKSVVDGRFDLNSNILQLLHQHWERL